MDNNLVVSRAGVDATVSQDEVLHIVSARAEEMCDEAIKRCTDQMKCLYDEVASLDAAMQKIDLASLLGDKLNHLLQIAAAAKMLDSCLAVGIIPTQGGRERDIGKSEALRVVLMIVKEGDLLDWMRECSPPKELAAALAAMVPGSMAMPERLAIYSAWSFQLKGGSWFELPAPSELRALQKQRDAVHKQIADIEDERANWAKKKRNIPSLERSYKAKIATEKLSRTEAGREILSQITANLDADILNLATA